MLRESQAGVDTWRQAGLPASDWPQIASKSGLVVYFFFFLSVCVCAWFFFSPLLLLLFFVFFFFLFHFSSSPKALAWQGRGVGEQQEIKNKPLMSKPGGKESINTAGSAEAAGERPGARRGGGAGRWGGGRCWGAGLRSTCSCSATPGLSRRHRRHKRCCPPACPPRRGSWPCGWQPSAAPWSSASAPTTLFWPLASASSAWGVAG